MEKNAKIKNKKQREKLVELMRLNPDIGRGKLPFGCNKMQLKEKWDEFTEQLNDLGPPIRTAREWQRIWTHHKANLKRKLAANKRKVQANGGGACKELSLSPLERTTAEIISMKTKVSPNRSAKGLESEDDSDASDATDSTFQTEDSSTIAESMEEQLQTSLRQSQKELNNDHFAILKTIATNQEEILRTLKRLEVYSYKNYEINKKSYELKKEQAGLKMALTKAKLKLTKKRLQEV